MLWVCPRVSSQLGCPENLQREASRRHHNQMPEPPQLAPFNAKEQRFYFEPLPDVSAPHPIPKGEPSHPLKKTNFGSCIHNLILSVTTQSSCE
ncbi:hypothetical protein LDENG_00217880 [Lucifuga dentata]|nr:hypothetical protein LDENG_00217880 [Lucifuga dentata]